jgi:hypothetical protein
MLRKTRRWREADSNRQSLSPKSRSLRRNGRCRRGERGSLETSPIPGDRGFESLLPRRRVCLTGAFHGYRRKRPGFAGSVSLYETREWDAGHEPARLVLFSLTGIDAVPLGKPKRSTRRAQALAWTHFAKNRFSAREQAALIDPVERQIEFGKTRRSEFKRLPRRESGDAGGISRRRQYGAPDGGEAAGWRALVFLAACLFAAIAAVATAFLASPGRQASRITAMEVAS